MAVATTEQQPPREVVRAPERLAYHEGLVGLHARLLLSGDAVNPRNIQIPPVDQFRPFDERIKEAQGTYVLANRASTRERKDWWEQQGVEGFDAQKKAWIDRTVATFTNAQDFFERTEKGQQWKEAFAFDTAHFGAQEAATLYDEYFTGAKKEQAVTNFVTDILSSYKTGEGTIDYEALRQDLPALQWLSGIFGEKSKEIVAQLTDAEAAAIAHSQELIASANAENRVNNLQEKEVELLTFLWGEQSETQEQPRQENLQNIIEARGFEEIERVGWPGYREALTRVSFSQMIENQMREAAQLREQAKANPQDIPRDELKRLNADAVQRANKLVDELPTQYTREKDNPFFCIKTDTDKLSIRGKQYRRELDIPHTRLYFTTYTHTAPEAFLSLFQALKDENALDTVNLSLNLENFVLNESELERVTAPDNTIILYLTEFTPETMRKIATAVRKAKQARPEYWQMRANDLAGAKEAIVYNFKIPLDETTGFVEMATGDSFDTTDRLTIGRELNENYNRFPIDFNQQLQLISARLKPYTPDNPGRFTNEGPGMKRRRKFMPGILFNEVASIQSAWEKVKNERFSDIGWQQASRIRRIVGPSELIQKNLPVYYPGAHTDIAYPLAFTDATNFVFTDFVYVYGDGRLREGATPDDAIKRIGGTIKSITTEGILGQGGKRVVTFDWAGKERKITMYAEDASKFTPTELQEDASMVLIRAPTPFSREVDSERPGDIMAIESLANICEHLAPNGFIHWYPTEYLAPEMIGFQKLFDAPDSDEPLYRYKNGYPLFQKVHDEPQITELLEIDHDVSIATLTRDGVMAGEISDRTLGYFKDELRELRTRYEQLLPEKRKKLEFTLRENLTPNKLTDEQKERLLQYGRAYGITDEQKALAYLQQANEVALKVFPELQEATN